ncbi:MAG: winged helix-turn-helix transcriptional regulator [FCB group bacterium]|nr:winged helix-turn-helix transcriptional regulator [FCB group bacterium]
MADTKKDTCSLEAVDLEKVKLVTGLIPDMQKTKLMAELFKAFSDPTRLQILQALAVDELCVCDISAIVEVSVSAISHQLRLLRNMHIVKNRKDGKMVYYSLNDSHIEQLIAVAKEHIEEL